MPTSPSYYGSKLDHGHAKERGGSNSDSDSTQSHGMGTGKEGNAIVTRADFLPYALYRPIKRRQGLILEVTY